MASEPGQSSFNPLELSSNEDEYLGPDNVAETTPGGNNCTACLFTTARLDLNSPPGALESWGQINLDLNDYPSNAM
jgi:hypothetical protein